MKSTLKSAFKDDVLSSKKTVLVDVWASWCGPCRAMEPVLEQLEHDVKDWAEIVKVDASVENELVQELGVSSLPTFLVFKDGEMKGSTIGAQPKSNLISLLEKAR
jgi:thioredoxin 1